MPELDDWDTAWCRAKPNNRRKSSSLCCHTLAYISTSQPVPDLAETCWNHYSFHKASNDFTTFNIWNQDDESRLGTNYESNRCLLLLFSVCIWLKFELARVVGSVDLLNSLQLCQDQHWKMSIQGNTVHNIARLWIMIINSKHSHNSLSHIYIYIKLYIYHSWESKTGGLQRMWSKRVVRHSQVRNEQHQTTNLTILDHTWRYLRGKHLSTCSFHVLSIWQKTRPIMSHRFPKRLGLKKFHCQRPVHSILLREVEDCLTRRWSDVKAMLSGTKRHKRSVRTRMNNIYIY